MRQIGLAAIAPGPNTSRPYPEHKVYPYLVARRAGGQAESGLEHGHHVHPVAARLRLLGGDNRLVLAPGAELADQQQHGSGVLCRLPGDALRHHGKPEIFNSDQGSQFTSAAFTDVLKRKTW